MFIDTGKGWHLNLAHVARIHVMDHGGAGTSLKFYSASGEALGECNPATPEQLDELLRLIQQYGRGSVSSDQADGAD